MSETFYKVFAFYNYFYVNLKDFKFNLIFDL